MIDVRLFERTLLGVGECGDGRVESRPLGVAVDGGAGDVGREHLPLRVVAQLLELRRRRADAEPEAYGNQRPGRVKPASLTSATITLPKGHSRCLDESSISTSSSMLEARRTRIMTWTFAFE